MKQWTGEGRTAEDAVTRGAAQLGLDRNEVEFQILGERASGLLSLFGFRRVRVRVTEKPGRSRAEGHRAERPSQSGGQRGSRRPDAAPRRPEGRQGGQRQEGRDRRQENDRPRRETRPADNRQEGFRQERGRGERPRQEARPEPQRRPEPRPRQERPFQDRAAEQNRQPRPPEPFRPAVAPEALLGQWKNLFGWDDLAWEIHPVQARRLPVKLKTAQAERLAGGHNLEAFEYLFNLISSGGDREKPWVSFQLDGFPTTDEQRAADQAMHAAFQVRRTGQPFRLDPMPSALRRLVHQALANNPDIETSSEGEGQFRKVVVKLKAGAAPAADPRESAPPEGTAV